MRACIRNVLNNRTVLHSFRKNRKLKRCLLVVGEGGYIKHIDSLSFQCKRRPPDLVRHDLRRCKTASAPGKWPPNSFLSDTCLYFTLFGQENHVSSWMSYVIG